MATLATAARLSWRQQAHAYSTTTATSQATGPGQFLLPARSSQAVRSSFWRPRRPLPQRGRYNSSQTTPPPRPEPPARSPPASSTTNPAPSTSSSSFSNAATAQAAKEARRRATAERIANSSLRFMPSFIGRRLRGPLENMIKSPGSHVVSFLIIHEITAILPLFGFMSLFVYMDWVPTAWVAGPWAAWALEGVRKYAGYFRKKGWFGMGGAEGVEGGRKLEGELEEEVQHQHQHQPAAHARQQQEQQEQQKEKAGWFGFSSKNKAGGAREGDGKSASAVEAHEEAKTKDQSTAGKVATTTWHAVKKVVTFDNIDTGYKTSIQFAAAYAITKMLLPARLALSVWLTPSGARVFSRMWRFVRGGPTAAK
ncbi:uncharacterized protein B0I36DRAFT_109722 [Microdochium trichocladiopsis]|uniref:Uncharacterized protein n=1 Tax=Microdochium trichocladiopsis TaxID=1682393 RepID=A0A9P9BS52_9PEZI|nr:uncharacterized protein B0I36DRAFT_109722 [Microdochium trichocladiopsis]KAH7033490.1 hypothetical protein B0I36DRAFT_109722 [Microdochium trichocladiopsis]